MKPICYIREFVGLSRFDSPHKPAIGNRKGAWYCDFPSSDQVGVTSDMKTYAAKNEDFEE